MKFKYQYFSSILFINSYLNASINDIKQQDIFNSTKVIINKKTNKYNLYTRNLEQTCNILMLNTTKSSANNKSKNTYSLEMFNSISIIEIIEIIITITIIFVIIISLYYRYYTYKYGNEPFIVPNFLPNIIFPRPSKDPLLRSTVERNLNKIFGDPFDSSNTHSINNIYNKNNSNISFEVVLKANSNMSNKYFDKYKS